MHAVLAAGGAGSVTVTESAGQRAGDRRRRDVLLRGMTILMDVGDFAPTVAGLSGIARAYSLLMVNRFREEPADGGADDPTAPSARPVARAAGPSRSRR
jgi:hypothetical protein